MRKSRQDWDPKVSPSRADCEVAAEPRDHREGVTGAEPRGKPKGARPDDGSSVDRATNRKDVLLFGMSEVGSRCSDSAVQEHLRDK